MLSTITPTQVFKAISPIVRKNVTHLFVYRLRNYGDLEGIIEELSAIYDKKTLLQLYHEAVSEDYSSLYVNLMQKRKERMSGNEWRHKRHHELLPDFGYYVDHLEPIVLLALNTGMRRGEIFHLRWSDVGQT